MNYSHILWDFNGTLLNDVEAGIKSANVLLKRRHMKTIDSLADYHHVFCFPIIEYYRNLGFDLKKESFDKLAVEWVEQYLIHSKESRLYDGTSEILTELQKDNIPQIILSATEIQMLTKQLKELGIYHYFRDVLGLDNIHAYSKSDIAAAWKQRVNPRKALLIGDTLHDYDVSRSLEADCILIANGHQSRDMLQTSGALVIDDIRELINYI